MKLKAVYVHARGPKTSAWGKAQNDAQYSVNGYPNIHLQFLDVKVLILYSVVWTMPKNGQLC